MKRPLLPCVTGLVLGEAAAISSGFKGAVTAALLFLLTGLCVLIWQKRPGRFFVSGRRIMVRCFMFAIFFMAGIFLYADAWADREPIPGVSLPLDGTIRGKITFLQVDDAGEYDITLENVQFSPEKKVWRSIRGKCRVLHLKTDAVTVWPGDWITYEGSLTALSVPTNPGEFNSEVYYQSRGISCQFFADSGYLYARGRFSLAGVAFKIKRRIDSVYDRMMGENHAALLNAMVLGDKSPLSEEQKRKYEDNGVAHLLSVSGLHVSILAGSWFRFLRKRKIGYAPACLGGMFFLGFYGCMTGFGSSIVRAIIMYAVYLGAEYFGAQYDMVSSTGLAGILMLLDSPWRLREGGCQMSFAAVISIALVLPWIKELAEKRRDGNDGRIYRFPRLRKKFNEALLSSVVISAVTLPVVLRVFFTFSPYSVFINLLVIPSMTPMMVSAIAAGIAGVFLLPAGTAGTACSSVVERCAAFAGDVFIKLLILPAEAVLTFFDFFLEQMRQLPGAVLTPGCPALMEMAAIYALEGMILYIWYRRRWKLGVRAALLLGLWFLLVPSDGRLKITMLDVGQGDSILLQLPGGESVLIDGGSTSRSGVGQYVITPALQYYGIAEIDYVVATHMDADHVSGIEELIETGYPVRYLLLSAGEYGKPPDGQTGESSGGQKREETELAAFARKAERAGIKAVYFQRGDGIQFQKGAALRCLHPFAGFEADDKNAASLVFHLSYGRFDALFTGDLESSGEEALCSFLETGAEPEEGRGEGTGASQKESGQEKEIIWELLKVAHHGSRYSTDRTFLETVSPQAALVSAGKKNRYGHPHEETLERLADCGAKIYMTMEAGAIFVETDGIHWGVDTFSLSERQVF